MRFKKKTRHYQNVIIGVPIISVATGMCREQQAYALFDKVASPKRRDGRADRQSRTIGKPFRMTSRSPPVIGSVSSVIQQFSIGTLDRLTANAPLQLPNSHCCQNQTSRSFRAALWLAVFLHDDASTGLLCQEPVGGGAELSRWAPCTMFSIDLRRLHYSGVKNHKDQNVRVLLLEI